MLAVVGVGALGAALERLAIRPLRRAPALVVLIVTIGASIALRGGALIVWGTDPFALPPFSAGPPLSVLGAVVVRQGVWVLLVAALVFAGLWFCFTRAPPSAPVRSISARRASWASASTASSSGPGPCREPSARWPAP